MAASVPDSAAAPAAGPRWPGRCRPCAAVRGPAGHEHGAVLDPRLGVVQVRGQCLAHLHRQRQPVLAAVSPRINTSPPASPVTEPQPCDLGRPQTQPGDHDDDGVVPYP
jgi:hypothetical protein